MTSAYRKMKSSAGKLLFKIKSTDHTVYTDTDVSVTGWWRCIARLGTKQSIEKEKKKNLCYHSPKSYTQWRPQKLIWMTLSYAVLRAFEVSRQSGQVCLIAQLYRKWVDFLWLCIVRCSFLVFTLERCVLRSGGGISKQTLAFPPPPCFPFVRSLNNFTPKQTMFALVMCLSPECSELIYESGPVSLARQNQ